MLVNLKQFYWKVKATKGRVILWTLRALFAQCSVFIIFHLLGKKNKQTVGLENKTIVSLTSYQPRFFKLHFTLMALLNQSILPNKIILWVSEEDKERLPLKVENLLCDTILEIRTAENLGPGTKILPALIAFKGYNIVTADDDIYYPRNWLKDLVNSWDGLSSTIVAHRVHRIALSPDKCILPYRNWLFDIEDKSPNKRNFATGVGGVFYPSNCFNSNVTDFTSYKKLCGKQDDIWLYWMARENQSTVSFSGHRYQIINWLGTEDTGLMNNNLNNDVNDIFIENMVKHYGNPFI